MAWTNLIRSFAQGVTALGLLGPTLGCGGGGGPEGPAGGGGAGADAVVAGALTSPHPTLENLALEWVTTGDANGNATVSVRFRAVGAGTWRTALPLRWIPGGSNEGFTWPARFSGSVFDLQPGTTYELEASLVDPDGGSVVRGLTVATRGVPVAKAGAPVKAANPATLASVLGSALPGDIIQLGAGTYGGFTIPRSGAAGSPLVVRGGPGVGILGEIGIFDQAFVHLENLSVQGRIRFNGSDDVAITRCTIQATADRGGDGIVCFTRAERAYIADNVITGLTVWNEAALGAGGANQGEGICVTGPGHVIMNNRVSGMRDGISLLEDGEARDQVCIDILNNDLSECADDAIEADFAMGNCRIMRNRITNAFIACSSQPSLGGPTWFIRNTAYNVVHVAFKLYRGSVGDQLLHNTVVKQGDAFGLYPGRSVGRLWMRNNLLLGGPGGTYNGYASGSGRVFQGAEVDLATFQGDHDALGSSTGAFQGRVGGFAFTTLAELRSGTSEQHALQASLADLGMVAFPAAPLTPYAARDLRLVAGSALVDAAVVLPNVNEGYTGGGPDPGAHEQGRPLPTYGPR